MTTSSCIDGDRMTDTKLLVGSITMIRQQQKQQPSRVIPVLPFNSRSTDLSTTTTTTTTVPTITLDSSNHTPPDYAMIELNGELIAPIEYPSANTCQSILGMDGHIELGKLEIDSNGVSIGLLLLLLSSSSSLLVCFVIVSACSRKGSV
jgi:hypothetical protein